MTVAGAMTMTGYPIGPPSATAAVMSVTGSVLSRKTGRPDLSASQPTPGRPRYSRPSGDLVPSG